MKRLLVLLCVSCSSPPPSPPAASLDDFLPALPPTGGAAVCAAGKLTEANFATERVPGPASQGLPGDWFMRNDKIRVVVQAPNRAIGPCPFGGTLIDMDRVDGPAGDQLGEVAPFLQLGRTVDFRQPELVRDGSEGGPAVLRFRGHDVVDDYINVTGLGGFAGAVEDDVRADVDLGLQVAVTYVLEPGATHVEAYYTYFNPGDTDRATSYGTITDTGAQIEIFHPGVGYGEFQISDLLGPSKIPLVEYSALQGQGITYGIAPILDDAAARGAPFPISGVDVEVYQLGGVFDALGPKGQTLVVPSLKGVNREVDVFVARDAGDVEAAVRARKGQLTGKVIGSVAYASGAAAVGARVTVEDPSKDATHALVTTITADATGAFVTPLLPGTYKLTPEAPGYLRGASQMVNVVGDPGALVNLTVPDPAPLSYTVRDGAGNPIPARVIVVGNPPNVPDRRFRDLRDPLPVGVAGWLASREGDSSKMTAYDHPLQLAPGHYRVVIGRGPEWSRHEQVIDLAPGGATVDAVLERVVDTTGYVASDFHQHTYVSPDSPVPPLDRVVTYLAEGVEVVSTSEHDVHLDYEPYIQKLNADSLLDSMVGVEVTPFDYGHFIGFPLPVDPASPNGGALDWGNAPMTGLDLAPGEIFGGLRKLGAKVVQVNHPRAVPGSDVTAGFQKNFDRAALTFDFASHSFGGNAAMLPVKASELGLPDGAQLFSPDFNALEVYNGVGFRHVPDGAGARIDPLTDACMRDWMNFLSFGFAPTAVGDSDSHEWVAAPAGLPRTLVRVADDSPAAIAAGVADEVAAVVAGEKPRDVVVTNGPMLWLTVDGAGMGATAKHASGPLAIEVKVQTPTWAPVDTVEIFANATFDVPLPKGQTPPPPAPAICFTSRQMPSPRCAAAVGGARPLALATVPVGSAARLEADLQITVDADALLALERAGAVGKDLWLVARATGDVGLFPTLPQGLDPADVAAIVDGGPLDGKGVPALAFTNPVFVDVDGGGWKAPFAP